MTMFPSIRIEGGLLGPDVLDQLLAGDLPGQRAADFGLEAKRSLTDEIAAAFADAPGALGRVPASPSAAFRNGSRHKRDPRRLGDSFPWAPGLRAAL